MKNPPPSWDLVTAIYFIRELQPWAYKNGFNLHLGGGVLDRGWSTNDVDILAMPRAQNPVDWRRDTSEEYLCNCIDHWYREPKEKLLPNRRIVRFSRQAIYVELIFVRL
jgi:hypothetical protein